MNSPLSSNSWIGRLIGDNQRYRLLRSLGRGGMGEVFLASDTRLNKEVALKLLKDKWLASGEMQKRFEREIAICAALQSDHIIEISDCGVSDEGFPFYVMEYLRGQTLRNLMLREKQLTPERTVTIMKQVCKGLQLAHQGVVMGHDAKNPSSIVKVVHRDLKPDNIFLLPKEFGEWVKILDFGIAKIHKESSEQTNLTKTFIGTFRYSSPEQIQNDKNIDGRSDIYSLGIILYEMLTALDPFGLSIDRNRVSESSWLHAHGYREPIPFKSRPGCTHLSPELEAVVLKCLQKKPVNRFASVTKLSLALETALQSSNRYPQHKQVIVKSQSQQTQLTTNDETVAKPVQETKQTQRIKGSNEETVFKPKSQTLQNQSQVVNPQAQPLPNPNLNPSNQIQQQPNTIQNRSIQQSPSSGVPYHSTSNPQPKTPEGTIYQSRKSQDTNSSKPEGTIYQSRSANPEPPKPDGTIYQSRPSNTNPKPQQSIDGTIYQSRNGISQGTPQNPPYQPRTQSKPEGTVYQPRNNNRIEPQKKQFNIVRTIGTNLNNVWKAFKNFVRRLFGG